VKDEVSNVNNKTGDIMVLYILSFKISEKRKEDKRF
jgi:hypothetical protein